MGWVSEHAPAAQVSQYYLGYLREAEETVAEAAERLRSRESLAPALRAVIDVAHRIKGNAAMYGQDGLGVSAARTERDLRAQLSQFSRRTALALIEGFGADLARTCEALAAPVSGAALSVVPDAQAPQPSSPARPERDRPLILVALGDIYVAEFLAELLSPDFDTMTVHRAVDAVRASALRQPDLLVIQDGLDGEGAGDVAREIKQTLGTAAPDVFAAFAPGAAARIADALAVGLAGFTEDPHGVLDITAFCTAHFARAKPSILLADDDPVVRDLLGAALRSAGYAVSCVADGVEALEHLQDHTPDLILLDRFMPRLEGGTVLHEMQGRVNLKSIPVLVLTGMANQGEARSWFARGAADFIPKPFDPEEVLMRVRRHLQVRKATA